MRFIDCQGFAGGVSLGFVQAGFELVGKRELPGGFGVESMEANRHLLGDGWQTQAVPWQEWEAADVDVVAGSPPCSGFSYLSPSTYQGKASKANDCMWALIHFAAKCSPETVVFESVQGAYKKGRELMVALREKMEELTGEQYGLYHVLDNAQDVGGCAVRRRYFFVISRSPFQAHVVQPADVPTVTEAIGDLEGLDYHKTGAQNYRRAATWWSEPKRHPLGVVDGHFIQADTPRAERVQFLMDTLGWEAGESYIDLLEKGVQAGVLPEELFAPKHLDRLERGTFMRSVEPWRWRAEDPCRVVNGDSGHLVIHPNEPRPLTLRELYRIQGFPDNWLLEPAFDEAGNKLWTYPGKGIPVEAGRWVADAIYGSMHGLIADGPVCANTLIGDREWVVEHPKADAALQKFGGSRRRTAKTGTGGASGPRTVATQAIQQGLLAGGYEEDITGLDDAGEKAVRERIYSVARSISRRARTRKVEDGERTIIRSWLDPEVVTVTSS